MIYDGNSSSPAASIVLGIKRLRDSFGEYLSYQPFFLFRSGVSISIKDYFNRD